MDLNVQHHLRSRHETCKSFVLVGLLSPKLAERICAVSSPVASWVIVDTVPEGNTEIMLWVNELK